jgi:arylformamidase
MPTSSRPAAGTLFDVSMPIRTDGPIYPGNPPIVVTSASSMARGDSSDVSSLSFGSHTGTHVDAPSHMEPGGPTLDDVPLTALIGRAIVIEIADDVRAIGERELRAAELSDHVRVLMRTRNSRRFAEFNAFEPDYTFLAPDGAEFLVSRGCVAVGIDALSIEQFHSGHHRTHHSLLRRGVAIIEGLALADVPPGEYELLCLPLRIAGVDGAPARVVLRA